MAQTKIVETPEDLQQRIIEIELEKRTLEYDILTLRNQNKELEKKLKSEAIILEEEYLREIQRLNYVVQHYRDRLVNEKHRLQCDFCGGVKKKMTIYYNLESYEVLNLCFKGCQNFPEPYRDTKAGANGQWIRIDPWQNYKLTLPRLQKHGMGKPLEKNQSRLNP